MLLTLDPEYVYLGRGFGKLSPASFPNGLGLLSAGRYLGFFGAAFKPSFLLARDVSGPGPMEVSVTRPGHMARLFFSRG
jgi:hypothetical protein